MEGHGALIPNDDFKKIIPAEAPIHSNGDIMLLAAAMGPADEANPEIPSGYTYFGQFVDHDITFTAENDINARTPVLDLDSLYGDGPDSERHSHLFEESANGEKLFIIGNPANQEGDLFRNEEHIAQIPDPRNDENIIIASIQLLFQKFHNKLVSEIGLSFEDAKKTVKWHYQSAVLNDFLIKIVGRERVDDILLNGRKLYKPASEAEIFMPTEFSAACYRFGHSMVRSRYSFNDFFEDTRSDNNLFFGFPRGRPGAIDGRQHQITPIWTLQGPAPNVGQQSLLRFFDPSILDPNRDADNFSGKIDTKLPAVLFNLEVPTGEMNVLSQRNLLTGQRFKLPNGQQAVAFAQNAGVQVTALTPVELQINASVPESFADNTPLWFYTLREAEIQESGRRLGALGGTIVAETLIGLLELDNGSFIHSNNSNSEWPFTLPGVEDKKVSVVDIVNFVDGRQAN